MLSRTFQTFRKELNPDSKIFRHAIRSAFAVAISIAISRYLNLEHGIWLPITVMIIMRPSLGGTIRFGWKRGLGTIIGAVIGIGLLFAFRTHTVVIVTVFILPAIFLMVFLRAFNYTLYVVTLTATVVLCLGIMTPMGWKLGLVRILDNVMGIFIGVATAFLIWPYRARKNLRNVMSCTIISMEEHFTLLSSLCNSRENREGDVISSRIKIVDNLSKCEESFREASAEPGINARQRQEMSRLLIIFYRIKDLLTGMFTILSRSESKSYDSFEIGLEKLLTDTGHMFIWLDNYINVPEECGEKPVLEESIQEFLNFVSKQRPAAKGEGGVIEQSRDVFALTKSIQSIGQELNMAHMRLQALRNGRKD